MADEQQPDHPSSAAAGPHGVGACGGVEAEQHGDDPGRDPELPRPRPAERPVQEEGEEQRDVDRADQRRERRPVAPRGGEEPGAADRPRRRDAGVGGGALVPGGRARAAGPRPQRDREPARQVVGGRQERAAPPQVTSSGQKGSVGPGPCRAAGSGSVQV